MDSAIIVAVSCFNQWLNSQEPRFIPREAPVRRLDQALGAESSSTRHGTHSQKVSVYGALTAGSLDHVPNASGTLILYFKCSFL